MGYTHYWTQKRDFTNKEWAGICDFTMRAIKLTKADIKGFAGTGEPLISKDLIALNGDEHEEFHHESFVLRRIKGEWEFCKTAYKPYDEVVTAILWYIKCKTNAMGISSDGGMSENSDWADGIGLYKIILSR